MELHVPHNFRFDTKLTLLSSITFEPNCLNEVTHLCSSATKRVVIQVVIFREGFLPWDNFLVDNFPKDNFLGGAALYRVTLHLDFSRGYFYRHLLMFLITIDYYSEKIVIATLTIINWFLVKYFCYSDYAFSNVI